MNLFIVITCALVALLLIVFYVIFCAKFNFYVKINNKDIKMYWGKSIIYNSWEDIGLFDEPEDKITEFEDRYKKMKKIINFLRRILDDKNDDIIYILKYTKKTFAVKKLDISLDYGFDDAALTGITGGVIWGIISGLSGFVGRFIDFKKFTNIAVKPYYTEKILDFRLDLVFDVSLYNYLKTKKLVKRFKKTLEGRR